ncbi:MAG: ribonuclease HII [Nitrospinota bacterium]
MREIENSLNARGFKLIAGVDEAGRGPLAGPVVASAVVLPKDLSLPLVNDSKKMSAGNREKALLPILENALSVGIGITSSHLIEKINILQATRRAMKCAVLALSGRPDYLLIDGLQEIETDHMQQAVKRGDSLSLSIAAASVVAKVTRDRLMEQLDLKYPQYLFRQHKGYGTKEHLMRIQKYGPCEIHRKTFRGVREWVENV